LNCLGATHECDGWTDILIANVFAANSQLVISVVFVYNISVYSIIIYYWIVHKVQKLKNNKELQCDEKQIHLKNYAVFRRL